MLVDASDHTAVVKQEHALLAETEGLSASELEKLLQEPCMHAFRVQTLCEDADAEMETVDAATADAAAATSANWLEPTCELQGDVAYEERAVAPAYAASKDFFCALMASSNHVCS